VTFRRLFVINRYIVDLYCAARRLVVEVDGGAPTNAESSTPNAIVSFIYEASAS
jgi:very-short-patch-repair endonuclease